MRKKREAMKKAHAQPGSKEKRGAALVLAFARPESKKKLVDTGIARYADPAERERTARLTKEAFAKKSPEELRERARKSWVTRD